VADAPVSVTVQTARLGTIRDTIVVPGTVVPSPAADWTIYAPEAGRIAEIPKVEGQAVKAGDLLVRFDLAGVSQEIATRQAEVAEATARMERAKAELARRSSLYDRGFTSRNDFEAAKAEFSTADAVLTSDKALLAAVMTLSDREVVKARFDGVVAKRWHTEGDQVDAATSDPVIRVIDPTRVQVAVHVSMSQLLRIVPGQQATVFAVGVPAGELSAVVSRPTPTDPTVTTAEVRLGFTGATSLVADMPVQVEILLDERPNVVVVPAASVVRGEGVGGGGAGAGGSQPYVMIASPDGKAHRRDVRLGLVTHDTAEIVAGVTPGDTVIVGGLADVVDGGPIAIAR
jgi:RND family efflux transporter MFP subunit